MRCFSSGQTDPGRVRRTNQDAWYADRDGRLFLVADGMGGHAGGEEASRLAIEIIRGYVLDRWLLDIPSATLLEKALLEANDEILTDQLVHPERAEMGTTVTALLYRQNEWWCAHVGDSRLYHWQQGQLSQMTEDHTWVARAVKVGELTALQARSHPWRHVLMQCLGREEFGPIDLFPLAVKDGDLLLLCSDGLTEELTDEAISREIRVNPSVQDMTQALVELAKANGGRDNITVVLVQVDASTETQ